MVRWQVPSTKSDRSWVWVWKSASPRKIGGKFAYHEFFQNLQKVKLCALATTFLNLFLDLSKKYLYFELLRNGDFLISGCQNLEFSFLSTPFLLSLVCQDIEFSKVTKFLASNMLIDIGKYSEPDCCWSWQLWGTCMASFSSLPTLHSTRWIIFASCFIDYFINWSIVSQDIVPLGLQKHSGDARAFSFLKILELIPHTSQPPSMLFVENVVGFEVCSS